MSNDADQPPESSDCLRPYWFPDGSTIDDLPQELRHALKAIVQPAYHDLVAGAPSALERLTATSAVHLTHLEVLDQIALGRELTAAKPEDRDKRIAGHLRLVGAKLRAAGFLHRLQQAREVEDGLEATAPTRQAKRNPNTTPEEV